MFIQLQYCDDCKKETMHSNNKCDVCQLKLEESKRVNYFSELNKLTLEQRIRRIEEWIYAHGCHHSEFPLMDG